MVEKFAKVLQDGARRQETAREGAGESHWKAAFQGATIMFWETTLWWTTAIPRQVSAQDCPAHQPDAAGAGSAKHLERGKSVTSLVVSLQCLNMAPMQRKSVSRVQLQSHKADQKKMDLKFRRNKLVTDTIFKYKTWTYMQITIHYGLHSKGQTIKFFRTGNSNCRWVTLYLLKNCSLVSLANMHRAKCIVSPNYLKYSSLKNTFLNQLQYFFFLFFKWLQHPLSWTGS